MVDAHAREPLEGRSGDVVVLALTAQGRVRVEACNGIAGIGALADGAEILAGEKGTLIRN
ncbi:TPA: hypothetical protein ACH1TP_004126 [Enterobacter roggenkampii]